MIPGLPSLPPSSQLLPMLHQAWLSRAATISHNSFIQATGATPTSLVGGPFGHLASAGAGVAPSFHFNPFMVTPPPTSSPDLLTAGPAEKRGLTEAAEDLSFSSGGKRARAAEIICPICSIAVRREDLVEHFETELKCLDNIRTLSPITRPASRSSRPSSVSPPHKMTGIGGSLSPSSPGYLENRWERFQRIRSKRRERIGVKGVRRQSLVSNNATNRHHHHHQDIIGGDEDIDIGDSLSDCGSAGASDTESANQTFGPSQYTEADVLRELSESDTSDAAVQEGEDGRRPPPTTSPAAGGGMRCTSCSSDMIVPVLNVNCWHLACEKCWLRAVGTSKCCAQCSSPASVRDLRKVQV